MKIGFCVSVSSIDLTWQSTAYLRKMQTKNWFDTHENAALHKTHAYFILTEKQKITKKAHSIAINKGKELYLVYDFPHKVCME